MFNCKQCSETEYWCECFAEKEQEVEDWFEKYEDDEFLKYDRIPDDQKPTSRRDLNAFIKLDKLVPETNNIIAAAEHDEIFLDVSIEKLARISITEEDVIYLVRCGVHFNHDSLRMFV